MANGLTMNTLVAKIVDDTKLSEKQVREVLKATVSQIQETLRTEDSFVTIPGLGTFRATKKGDRMARNPKTGEPGYVAPYIKPVFRASTLMRDVVNGTRD